MEQTVVDYYNNRSKYQTRDRILYGLAFLLCLAGLIGTFLYFFNRTPLDRYTKAFSNTTTYGENGEYAIDEDITWRSWEQTVRKKDVYINISRDPAGDYESYRVNDYLHGYPSYTVSRWHERYLFDCFIGEKSNFLVSENEPQLFTDAKAQALMRPLPLPNPAFVKEGTLKIDYSGYGSMDLEQEVFDYETWDYIVKQVFGDEDYVYTVDEISCYFDIEDDKITYYHYIIDLTKVGTSETGDYSFSCSNYDDREVYYSEYEWNVAEKVDNIDEIAVPLLENNVKH